MHQIKYGLIVLIVSSQIGAAADPPLPMDFCSALKDSRELHGRNIRISGDLSWGREAIVLYNSSCPDRVILDGMRWPWSISLSFQPGLRASDEGNSPSSAGKLLAALSKYRQRDAEIRVILEGRLFSNRDQPTYLLDGHPIHIGLGHLNSFPAQIEVTKVVDFEVKLR